MKVIWDPVALDAFEEAVTYLREHNPNASEKLTGAVLRAIETLADGRFDGPAKSLTTQDQVRVWWVAPYRLFYTRERGALHIVGLVHHRREDP